MKTEDNLYAKFEQFLSDYKDFNKFPGGFEGKAARDAAIMRLAELHSAGKYSNSTFFMLQFLKVSVVNYDS